jgi:hypothetical protein
VSLSVADANKMKLKPLALPGGLPAAAYVDLSGSGWVQKKGVGACGF